MLVHFGLARYFGDAIVAGGTGLYVSALLRGLDASAADPGRRAELEALLEREGLEALAARAEALEAGSTARIDARNPRPERGLSPPRSLFLTRSSRSPRSLSLQPFQPLQPHS